LAATLSRSGTGVYNQPGRRLLAAVARTLSDGDTTPSSSPLRVILAGHNGDLDALRSGQGEFTPETLSAAYARISRSPEPVPELRRLAREEVERARSSNRTIVFGLGHHSVAEHAVLSFDILGCSRLAIEALEWHRLCSFTEKSQRYITLDGDYVVPAELSAHEVEGLQTLIAEQNRTYQRLLPRLEERQLALHPEMAERAVARRVLEGRAKEDARYAVALATQGQLGFTCNARNLELIVRRMRQSHLEEVRRLGDLLFAQARAVVPSLLILADEEAFREAYGAALCDAYFDHGPADLARAASEVEVAPLAAPGPGTRRGRCTLVDHTPDPDAAVIASLLFCAERGPLAACREAARAMSSDQRRRLVCGALTHLSEHDAPPRAFEEAVFRFEIVLDASAMAQLKRHRMATQHWGPYDPDLGTTLPPEVEAIGDGPSFAALMERTAETYLVLRRSLGARGGPVEAAAYALTNAHRRRVAVTANLREVYHFSRLREDGHAQWDIRGIAADLSALVREKAPITSMLLGGKDRYAEIYRQAMGGGGE